MIISMWSLINLTINQETKKGVKEQAHCIGLLGDGLQWREKGQSGQLTSPSEFITSASVLPRPIRSFEGNHERGVESKPERDLAT